MKKKIFVTLVMIMACTLAFCAEEDRQKEALLIVQYGSSIDGTREKTIDLIFTEIKAANPNTEVREAYMAPMVRKRLDKKGIHKDSPMDALLRLHVDGYTKVCVLPTLILDGFEMSELRDCVKKVEGLFDNIKLGTPLLYTLDDFATVLPVLLGESAPKGASVVWVGHGNNLGSTGTYCMLDMMLQQKSRQHHCSTIEGYPNVQTTIKQLKVEKTKKVVLVPLLLVCGDHTLNDISKEYKSVLEAAGIQSTVVLRGFAELKEVRDIYVKKSTELLRSGENN